VEPDIIKSLRTPEARGLRPLGQEQEDRMYAIIESGGKQYRVKAGDLVRVERIEGAVGDRLELQQVLLVQDGEKLIVGQPYLGGASVMARIEQQGRGSKIRVFRMRRRKRFRKTQGHRQDFTGLRIEEIHLQ